MWKLQSLRNIIERSNPELERDPQRLIVLANEGKVISTFAGGLSFEYSYTIEVIVLDYAGHTDALFVPIIAWIRTHQSELLANQQSQDRGLEFRFEPLTDLTADIGIRVPVTERVVVKPDAAHPTRLNAEHPPEPEPLGLNAMAEHWQLYLKDKLIAEWSMDVPEERARFDSLRMM